MPDYRLYCLEGTGKVASGEWFDARSDDEAIVLVRARHLPGRCEIWEGNRLVAEVPARLPV